MMIRSSMFRFSMRVVFSLLAMVAVLIATASEGRAQCATCPAPTVAYQPVVAYQPAAYQTTVAQPRTGWYPGRFFDRLRLRRWGASAATPTYTAAYAPYNTSYTPYVTAYAPLTRTVAYQPAPALHGCDSCAQTSYYPAVQTVARPVILQAASPACCGSCSGGCSACSTGVSQAVYSEPASSCASCSTGSIPTIYSDSAITGPTTPAPQLPTNEPTPVTSNFPPAKEPPIDPTPVTEPEDPSALLRAPQLFPPHGDRADNRSNVNRPSVDVWNAVYRGPATASQVSHSQPVARTQADIDADGWEAVAR